MNRRQRRVKHKRRVAASQPGIGVAKIDPRVTVLEDIRDRARQQRKGKAWIITQMVKKGYGIREGADHKEPLNYFLLPTPSLALER